MQRILRVIFVTAVPVAVACLMPPVPTAQEPSPQPPLRVEVKATHERVSPGAIIQVKVEITEPQPISTGRGRFEFDGFESIDGIALGSPADDAYGVAVVSGRGMTISFVSPSASLASDSDYPLLTVAGRVPANAPMGVRFPFQIDMAALHLVDASGAVVPTLPEDGSVVTAPVLSVGDVTPGSGVLPAGSVVTIDGAGFEPDTKVEVDGAILRDVRYIDASRLEVVLGNQVRMQGTRIRVIDPDNGFRQEFYPYQRMARVGISQHPVLRSVYALFPNATALLSVIDLTAPTTGIALQNPGSTPVVVSAERLADDGRTLDTVVFVLDARTYLVRETNELFESALSSVDSSRNLRQVWRPFPPPRPGLPPSPNPPPSAAKAAALRLLAATPIQVLGIAVDAAGAATAVLPRPAPSTSPPF